MPLHPDIQEPPPDEVIGCRIARGHVETLRVESPSLPRPLNARIYLPPCHAPEEASYPVLYLLHGLGAADDQWDELGVDEAADRLIRSGRAPPFLIVMPHQTSGLDLEAAIVEVLIPFVEQTYGAGMDRASRAIGGVSRGAGWALRTGLRHPELFAAVGLHSPAVLSPDLMRIPGWAADIPPGQIPRLWIDIGERDPLRPATEQLTGSLAASGLPYAWRIGPGDHDAAYWTSHVEDYLRFYAVGWDGRPSHGRGHEAE